MAQTAKIHSTTGAKFAIPKVTSSIEHIKPVIEPIDESSCELKLMIKEGSPAGRISGRIMLETDCEDEPPLDIKVTGYIRRSK